MKVIFLQDVPRVGNRYDIKEVPDGYAMNFLIPRKLAQRATPEAVAKLKQKKQNIEVGKKVQEDLLIKNLEEIKERVLHIRVKADDKGHLFAGLKAKDIVEAMQKEHGADISEDSIKLKKPIKEIGEYEILLEITTAAGGETRKSSFKLVVEGDD